MLPLPFNIGKVEELLGTVTASNIALTDAILQLTYALEAATDQMNRQTQANREK